MELADSKEIGDIIVDVVVDLNSRRFFGAYDVASASKEFYVSAMRRKLLNQAFSYS